MSAIVRKELRELAGLLGLLLVLVTLAWIGFVDAGEVFRSPRDERVTGTFFACLGIGLGLAYLQVAGESARGTRELLLHRGVAPERIFAAKAAVGIGATVALAVLPVAAFYAVARLRSVDGPALDPTRLAEMALLALFGAAAWAVGAHQAASSARRPGEDLLRFGIAVATAGGAFVAVIAATARSAARPASPVALFLVLVLAFAALALGLARRRFVEGADADRPLGGSERWLTVALLLGLAFVPFWLGVDRTQAALADGIARGFGAIARSAADDTLVRVERVRGAWELHDGSGALVGTVDDEPFPWSWRVDRDWILLWRSGHDDSKLAPREAALYFAGGENPRPFGLESWFAFELPGTHARLRGDERAFLWRAALVQPAGHVRIGLDPAGSPDAAGELAETSIPLPDARARAVVARKGPGDERFSARTAIAGPFAGPGEAPRILVDLADRTLWGVDPTVAGGPLVELELPGRDRPVGLERAWDRGALAHGIFLERCDVIVGERGRWVLHPDGFRPFAAVADRLATAREIDELREIATAVVDRDPLRPRVEVRDARTGELLFGHAWEAAASDPRVAALAALTLARPPALTLASFLGPPAGFDGPPRERAPWTDPVVASGRRAWLLALHALLCAWRARARAVAAGDASGSFAWPILALAFGPWALLAQAIVDPAPVRADDSEPLPELLVRTA